MMQIPTATYRLQFNLHFRFTDAAALVPYLHSLGISHVYASPRFKARKGSSHGYDVADPMQINSELGTEEEFDRFVERLHDYGMGLLLDIVPNHMAATSENPWWDDVLENGRASRYASYFDIEWRPRGPKTETLMRDRVLVPILAEPYSQALCRQAIALRLDERGFFVDCQQRRLPLNPRTYREILDRCAAAEIASALATAARQLADDLKREHAPSEDTAEAIARLKRNIWVAFQGNRDFRAALERIMQQFNGKKGEAASFRPLDSLLAQQAFRLADWHTASREINYRRFFDISDLVGLRVEDPAVFAARHASTLSLIAAGKISGLRVDHVDGLLDPLGFLESLARQDFGVYTVVEKITCGPESLPQNWPVAGTTGYDFLNAVNALFVQRAGRKRIEADYRRFARIKRTFAETWRARKKQVMKDLFSADLDLLVYRLGAVAALDPEGRDIPMAELRRALAEVTAALPIYRTYYRDPGVSGGEHQEPPALDHFFLQRALRTARAELSASDATPDAIAFLQRVLLAELPLDGDLRNQTWLAFVLRWQQFSGAVMAKGLEDTTLFIHHGLISLNEVGGNPFRERLRFNVNEFHRFNRRSAAEHPHTLLATSTHDTKWSEDLRARINVISEMPAEWNKSMRDWSALNRRHKTLLEGRVVPTPNEEVLLYQAMLGTWPIEGVDPDCLRRRLQQFLIKAAREAKTNTSWTSPNERHEEALRKFVVSVVAAHGENEFSSSFCSMLRKIAFAGACNSCSQALLKMTCPGVPDFYQGSELWNFALTDPDNRQPVDFPRRIKLLEELQAYDAPDAAALCRELLRTWQDGRLKLYTTMRVLQFRRERPELFRRGSYLPLRASGMRGGDACCFARNDRDEWIVVAVPRFARNLAARLPAGPAEARWRGHVALPARAPSAWKNLFTNETLVAAGEGNRHLDFAEIFGQLPFAALISTPLVPSGK
ncbi:MAG: malto-oligosyltrehalose synthase [Candidatus Acidiferrales bacterium]